MAASPPRVIKGGKTNLMGREGWIVRLLRDPSLYPNAFLWNEQYREATKSRRAYLDMAAELARVDAAIFSERFSREQYAGWLDEQVAKEEGAWWSINSSVVDRLYVHYRGGPAGFTDVEHGGQFRNPYVEVVVSSEAIVLLLSLAFKGT